MFRELKNRYRGLWTDLSSPDYGARAFARAARRKSAWNFALVPLALAAWGLVWFGSVYLLWNLHNVIRPADAFAFSDLLRLDCRGVRPLLLFLAPLLGAIPSALLLANFAGWCIPPVRRTLIREAEGIPHSTFRESQIDLSIIAMYMTSAGLIVGAIGAVIFPNSC